MVQQFKIDLLKRLLEAQFDHNQKFKTEINTIEALLLRLVPIGRDLNGNQYWYHLDEEHTLRIYREHPNLDRDWKLICQDKDQFTQLIDDVENGKTQIGPLDISVIESSTEEEKIVKSSTKKNKKKGKKGRHKHAVANKLVNGHKEDVKPASEAAIGKEELVDSVQLSSHTETIVKEKLKKGRKALNRSLFTSSTQPETTESVAPHSAIKQESQVTDDGTDRTVVEDSIEKIVEETISCLLDQLELNTNNDSRNYNANLDDSCLSLQDSSSVKGGKRPRKKKGAFGELSRLLGDNALSSIEDLVPIKRSSRIQKLQEKKDAERKIQMQLEQQRLEEELRLKKAKKTQMEMEQESNQKIEPKTASSVHSDDSDESFKVINKSRKKQNESSDTENEFVSLKQKKKRGRKKKKMDKRDKLDSKKSKLKKGNHNWSSNDEEFFNCVEDEEEVLKFEDKDDEFACEELEEDVEPVVLKRARTARKAKIESNSEEQDEECVNDDTPCQKCNLYTNPEWILLCDNCDLGYHTECLLPKLYIIPDGDWYCPKCENEQLLNKLRFEYENYVSNLAKREREQLRKQRLKFVDINIDNILTEDSTSRKSKASRKKYNEDYDSDLEDDSDLDDEDSNRSADSASTNYDSDDSALNRKRKKFACSTNSRRNNRTSSVHERRSRPTAATSPRTPKQRKRRRSYSDESDDDSDELNSGQDDAQSSDSSLPKQRSARKRVSYQFKEYDDLTNSAIQASDYDDYAENEEDEDRDPDEEEEDSDDGKSPFSKGKDISNLMAAENPFETKSDASDSELHIKSEEQVNQVNQIEQPNQVPVAKQAQLNIDEDDREEDERKITVSAQATKGKQKAKRKLNDLDSPVEEAENDSDFTIKDESNTELEEDDTEMESNDFSQDTQEDDDSDLEDWGRKTRKRNTRIASSRSSKRSKKRKRRYDSDDEDDESDYGYKTRRVTSKRVTYKEISTSEDFSDDYSDNSEKFKKNKRTSEKKKKQSESDDDFETDRDSDERPVLNKKKKKTRKLNSSSNDEQDVVSSVEEGKRKSKRAQKKKVYNDFTDIDESEEEQHVSEEAVIKDELKKESNLLRSEILSNAKQQSVETTNEDQLVQIQVTHVQMPTAQVLESTPTANDKPAIKRTPKIKITKPNPKLVRNLTDNVESPSLIVQPTEISRHTLEFSSLPPLADINKLDLPPSQVSNNGVEETAKKKRTRKPKTNTATVALQPEECVDPTATTKRGRTPKLSNPSIVDQTSASEDSVNVNSSIKPPPDRHAMKVTPPTSNNQVSVLSQLTQIAQSGDLSMLHNAQLSKMNINRILLQQQQQLMASQVARQALLNSSNAAVDKKSQLLAMNDSTCKPHKSTKSTKSSTRTPAHIASQTKESQAASLSASAKPTSAIPHPPAQPQPHYPTATSQTSLPTAQPINHHSNPNAAALHDNPYSSAFVNPQQIPQSPHVGAPPAPPNYAGYHLPPHFFNNNQHGPPSMFNHQPPIRPSFSDNFNNHASPHLASQFTNQFSRFPMPGYPQSPYGYDPYQSYSPYYPAHPQMANHHPYYGPPQPNQIIPTHHLPPAPPPHSQVNSTSTTTNSQSTPVSSTPSSTATKSNSATS